MAIVENKLRIIIVISIFLFSMITVVSLINATYEPYEMEGVETKSTAGNYTQFEEGESEDATNFIQKLIGSIFLQIEGAPLIVNGVMGFISGIMIFALVFTLVAFIRELVGFT